MLSGGLTVASDAEKATVGAVLLDSNVLTLLDGVVTANDFGDGQFSLLWDGIQLMRSRREPVDVITVGAALLGWGVKTVTAADLHSFVSSVPHAMSARQYAAAVREDAMRRNVRQVAATMLQTVDANPGRTLADGLNQLRDVQNAHELKKFNVTTLADILSTEDSFDWVVPGLLEKRDRLLVTGGEGSGKSTLVRQLAILAAAGLHPLTFKPMKPVQVLVVDAENSESQWRRASRGVAKQAKLYGSHDPGDVRISCTPRMDLTRDADLGQVHRLLDDAMADVVVIGPLYRLIPRAINGDDDAAPLLAALDTIRDRGCALVIEAHAGHALNQGGERDLRPRGSAALMGWPEMGIGIRLPKPGSDVFEIVRWRGDRDRRDIPAGLMKGGDWPWTPVI
jgi:replicative DNA helicase